MFVDAIDGETTHPSVEETENKGGEYHGKLYSLRIDSADSGIEEAKQEEGERYCYCLCYVYMGARIIVESATQSEAALCRCIWECWVLRSIGDL